MYIKLDRTWIILSKRRYLLASSSSHNFTCLMKRNIFFFFFFFGQKSNTTILPIIIFTQVKFWKHFIEWARSYCLKSKTSLNPNLLQFYLLSLIFFPLNYISFWCCYFHDLFVLGCTCASYNWVKSIYI